MKEKTPKNKCWIVSVGNDDFNYHPALELISAVKRYNKKTGEGLKMFRSKAHVQKLCDQLNSL